MTHKKTVLITLILLPLLPLPLIFSVCGCKNPTQASSPSPPTPTHTVIPSISTVAGNGTAGYAGDGGTALSAKLYNPNGVALDGSGNFYIADTLNYRIRMVDSGGSISTVAGKGTAGYSGDGGAALSAELFNPGGVAVGPSRNLYIADTINNRIRKVNAGGIITTVAGNGTAGYAGDGGAATLAKLCGPRAVALDATGNLYIADEFNNRIRKVDTGGIITTVAGNGIQGYSEGYPADKNAKLNGPRGVALDATGNLYIADTGNNRIRMVDSGGSISTVAGNGTAGYAGDDRPAQSCNLYWPSGVALDASGNLFIADFGNNRIRKVDTGGIITTVAGNGSQGYSGDVGPATSAALYWPGAVALDTEGNLYIADSYNQRIRKVTLH